jgi:hypothetical protein
MKTTIKSKPTAAKAAASPKPAAAQKPSTPTTPAKPEQKPSIGYAIRKICVTAYPTVLSNEIISATLIASGITGTKASTISTAKQDCINTLKVAQELGCWKPMRNAPAAGQVDAARPSQTPAASEPVLAS